ncbi:MAG: GNAT family N-acetyltransferase [Bacteroidia bacterium]
MNTRVKILVLDSEIMLIREYKPSDREACIKIFASNESLYFAPDEFFLFENWLNAKDKGKIAYKSNQVEHFYVVEQNSKVIACGGFYIPADSNTASMTWGMVENGSHKRGIGKKLLIYRIEEIKQSYPKFSIMLDTSQHTFKFFEKQDFSVTKITKDAYGEGLDRYDMTMN